MSLHSQCLAWGEGLVEEAGLGFQETYESPFTTRLNHRNGGLVGAGGHSLTGVFPVGGREGGKGGC